MSKLSEALCSDRFIVTAELNPPKGADVGEVLTKGAKLKGLVDAVNVTDQHAATMTASPIALGHLLSDAGIEPILQMTCRDRNRIALQSDLLGAYILGIENVLCLGGDPVNVGDHPNAKPVFDLSALELIKAATTLARGQDMAGKPLKGAPRFCLGAAANPGNSDPKWEVDRFAAKLEAGAQFFQTQAVFDLVTFEAFVKATEQYKAPILAGVMALRSGRMARQMNERLPGIRIPQATIDRLDSTTDPVAEGIALAGELVKELSGMCRGVHLMSVGAPEHIPHVLEVAGLLRARG